MEKSNSVKLFTQARIFLLRSQIKFNIDFYWLFYKMAGAFLQQPNTTKFSEENQLSNFKFGSSQMQGKFSFSLFMNSKDGE